MDSNNISRLIISERLILPALVLFVVLFGSGCSETEPPINPFDNQISNQDTVRLEITEAESSTIAGIYYNVFQPTCGNVGCHDGTFEPDFGLLRVLIIP